MQSKQESTICEERSFPAGMMFCRFLASRATFSRFISQQRINSAKPNANATYTILHIPSAYPTLGKLIGLTRPNDFQMPHTCTPSEQSY